MKGLRAWILRIAGLFSEERRERELADEIASHLQMHTDDNLRSGMSEGQARRDAILKLGGVETTKEAYRDRSTVPFIEQLLKDVRFGARQLIKNPGFAFTTIFILALGIGASTAIFSAVNPILFEPLPYPHSERLMMIWEMRNDGPPLYPTFGSYRGAWWGGCAPVSPGSRRRVRSTASFTFWGRYIRGDTTVRAESRRGL
jgi:hypothetical protein